MSRDETGDDQQHISSEYRLQLNCPCRYRMVEFHYWREGSGGSKSRLESVVLFLPDVWSAQPARFDWNAVQERYRAAGAAHLAHITGDDHHKSGENAENAVDADLSLIVCSQFSLVWFNFQCQTSIPFDGSATATLHSCARDCELCTEYYRRAPTLLRFWLSRTL